jgi:hypothetical protein
VPLVWSRLVKWSDNTLFAGRLAGMVIVVLVVGFVPPLAPPKYVDGVENVGPTGTAT